VFAFTVHDVTSAKESSTTPG